MLQIRESNFDDGIVEVDCGSWHKGYEDEDRIRPPTYFALRIRKNAQGKFEAYKKWHTSHNEGVAFIGTLEEVVAWVNRNYPSQSVKVVA
jgi:hypothetical protein